MSTVMLTTTYEGRWEYYKNAICVGVPVSIFINGIAVSDLELLKRAQSLYQVAQILGYRPQALSYLLYKLPDDAKYTTFQIPKKSGACRTIDAPTPKIKKLQRRLATVLTRCLLEIEKATEPNQISHAFRPGCSIITNAERHRAHRYVLNLDLVDFFPSFNFGRVRGFFLKNRHFAFSPSVATIIAQIACKNGALPQGSPSSPIISELVTHFLDIRLVQLAAKYQCTYSRYADDITFSTTVSNFPTALAMQTTSDWVIGSVLAKEITRAGFNINDTKTRMQYRASRQIVTGLVVNSKINVRVEYYKIARAMVHSLLTNGRYKQNGIIVNRLDSIEGILNHIFQMRERLEDERINREQNLIKRKQLLADRSTGKRQRPSSIRVLFHRMLFYKHFVDLPKPLIVCEGPTDSIYLKEAIRASVSFHPRLGVQTEGTFNYKVRFFRYTKQSQEVLQLGGGTGDIKFLLESYDTLMKSIKHTPFQHPVVLLLDNDQGSKPIFSLVKKKFGVDISHGDGLLFHHITSNIYIVKTPSVNPDGTSYIEELFSQALRDTKIEGKSFNPDKAHEAPGEYGKVIFANSVIKSQANKIDFRPFHPLLTGIIEVMKDYSDRTASLTPKQTVQADAVV